MTVYAHLLEADTWVRPVVWTLFSLFVVAVGLIWNLFILISTPSSPAGDSPPDPERRPDE